jgi:hypothetical protein
MKSRVRITAGSAQLSIRDLRLKPLRPIVDELPASQLELAVLDYLAAISLK